MIKIRTTNIFPPKSINFVCAETAIKSLLLLERRVAAYFFCLLRLGSNFRILADSWDLLRHRIPMLHANIIIQAWLHFWVVHGVHVDTGSRSTNI